MEYTLSATTSWIFLNCITVVCFIRTFISPLSFHLIKALSAASGAVIHVIAEDNRVISQWCLQLWTMVCLTISQIDQFTSWNLKWFYNAGQLIWDPRQITYLWDKISLHNNRTDLISETNCKSGLWCWLKPLKFVILRFGSPPIMVLFCICSALLKYLYALNFSMSFCSH